jgi:hypothetical protein
MSLQRWAELDRMRWGGHGILSKNILGRGKCSDSDARLRALSFMRHEQYCRDSAGKLWEVESVSK